MPVTLSPSALRPPWERGCPAGYTFGMQVADAATAAEAIALARRVLVKRMLPGVAVERYAASECLAVAGHWASPLPEHSGTEWVFFPEGYRVFVREGGDDGSDS